MSGRSRTRPVRPGTRARIRSTAGDRRELLLQVGALVLAALVLGVFLTVQRTTSDTTYGAGRSVPLVPPETPTVTLPTVDELVAQLARERVVRLPGATARWDTAEVSRAIGDADIRVLVTPGGLTDEQAGDLLAVRRAVTREQPDTAAPGTPSGSGATDAGTTGGPGSEEPVRDVLIVSGTRVTGDPGLVLADDLPSWRDEFAAQDVTTQLLTLVSALRDTPRPQDVSRVPLREPTAAELAPVLAAVRADRRYVADGASLGALPEQLATAFPGDRAVVAVFPAMTTGSSLPDWGGALAAALPDTPVVTVVGRWVSYAGPDAASFADVAGASFYGQYREILGRRAVTTDGLLGAWLGRVAELRYSGIFGRPLPYQPVDPLAVALPALPVVFVLCAGTFVFLTVRRARRPRLDPGSDRARLAGLSGLLVEVSGLVGRDGNPALARAAAALTAAQEALDDRDTAGRARVRLAEAQRELDAVARALRRPEYRPAGYLAELAR